MRCRTSWFLSVGSATVIVFFWVTTAWFGFLRAPEIKLGTSIDTNTGGAHEALEVFNENFLNRAAFLNPMPTMVVVGLTSGSDRQTVLGEELREFSTIMSNLSTCVKPQMTCHFDELWADINWNSVQCNEICKIPGAVCGGDSVPPFFHEKQPNFYNTIAAVHGYFEDVAEIGDALARKRYISDDNRTAILVLEGTVPKCSNTQMYYPLTDWIRSQLEDVFGPSGEFEYGVTSWSEQMRATAAGAVGDASQAHIITLPIAWFILFATVGPSALYVVLAMPVSLFSTLFILVPLQTENGGSYHWAHISPGMWVSILIAMSIDYALFILSRWREERLSGTEKIPSVLVSVQTAGKTVFLSGLILAMSFFSLLVIQTPLVQQVGVSCGILILVCMAVNLTLIPALLILTPNMKCCYVKNKYISLIRRMLAEGIIESIGNWPWCIACVRTCLSNVDEHLNEREDNETTAYNRLEMKNVSSSFAMGSTDSVGETNLDVSTLDDTLDETMDEDVNAREMKEVERPDPKQSHLLSAPVRLGPNGVSRYKRALSTDTCDSSQGLARSSGALSVGSGDADPDSGMNESYAAIPSLQIQRENDLKEPLGGNGSLEEDLNGSVNALTSPTADIRIPGSSIWVKIATTCRERPLTVILVMLVLGAPLSFQCSRFETSQNFTQLFLAGSPPIRAMNQIQAAGFDVGILNKQYIVASLGASRALGPGVNVSTDASGSEAGAGGDSGTGHRGGGKPGGGDEGEGVKDGVCVSSPCIRYNRACYKDDPDGILEARNQTCARFIPKMEEYLRPSFPGADESSLKEIICRYDPHLANPAFPRGYTTSYVCPVTCENYIGQNCTLTSPPTPSPAVKHPTIAPTAQPDQFEFESLFECNDDEGDWISKLTPCLIAPDKKTYLCKRPGQVNCGLAGPAMGKSCNDHRTGVKVGAGGQKVDEVGHRSVTWGNLCPKTCEMCPYQQRIFTPPLISNMSDLVDGILNLRHSVGPTGLRTMNYLDGRHVDFATAVNYLKQTKPNQDNTDPSFEAKAFRHNLRRTKSMTGAAAVIELTPEFNSVGAVSGKWVRELRGLLKEKEAEAQANGVEWKLYLEGMAPILADLQDEMYESAPYYMAAAVITVVILLTAVSFQSLTMGIRLLVTVAFSLSWVFGIMVVLLQDIKIPGSQGDGMSFIVPIMNVPVLVGLTLDYDLFLLVRIHEYRLEGFSSQDATMAAMYKTSGIITVAGLIMLTAFSALISSSLFVLRTTGLLVFLTCLIDTFLVRAWLVPALLMVGVEWNWWPGKVPPVTRRVHVNTALSSL